MKIYKDTGWKPKKGFQLRYVYFLKPECRKLLTVPEIPFSRIDEMGAGMYKGKAKRPADGSNLATSQARRFDSDPDAPKEIK